MLGEREKLVLHTIMNEYIQSREPVGSRNVSKIGPLKMSPATIRNIMGDLEEKGYLIQPYTSSGRVPTDQAYRYYVDHLVEVDIDFAGIADIVHESMVFDSPNVPAMLQEFSKRLGFITKHMGFVAVSDANLTTVRQLEFVKLNKNAVLVVLISKGSFIQNILINTETEISVDELLRVSNYINTCLPKQNFSDILNNVKTELALCKGEIINLLTKLVDAEKNITLQTMFLEGTSNIVDFPEFRDTDTLKSLLHTIEEKKRLSDIIEKCMQAKGVQIFVGRETGFDIDELGVVAGSYKQNGKIIGMIGVIGPKRMQYDKIISVVNYSTHIIEKMINQLSGGDDE